MKQFNFLPLHERHSFLFPGASLISANENEAFRIAFFKYQGNLFEVCYNLSENNIEDIRYIDTKTVHPLIHACIYGTH